MFWAGFVRAYSRLLEWALSHRWIVVGIAVLSFGAGVALIPHLPTGFIPQLDQGEFYINYTAPLPAVPQSPSEATATASEASAKTNPALAAAQTPPVNPLAESVSAARKLEEFVLKSPEVETVFTTVGTRNGQPNTGRLYVKLHQDRSIHTAVVQDQFRRQLPAIPGVTVNVEDIPFVDTGSEKPLQVALVGEDPQVLSQTAKAVQQRMKKLPGFVDITVTGTDTEAGKVAEIDRLNSNRVVYISSDLEKELRWAMQPIRSWRS